MIGQVQGRGVRGRRVTLRLRGLDGAALCQAGIGCLVAAPSKLQRPVGDRVKTDARDAAHPARLLHLGQIVEVAREC